MKQVYSLTSTYSSDEFGICSALYELGGMVVMHDASGCNSTYTTHDEPRWYDMDSMIFISAISEMEAIMGDDDKFIQDLVDTARELKPKFIALVGAPIPYMIGTDFDAIAQIVESQTKIPCFGFSTNGMQLYTKGISMALSKIVDYFCAEKKEKIINKVNILGCTPLDFSINGSIDSIKQWLEENDLIAGVSVSMNCTLEDIQNMSDASLNLVVSYGGLEAAKILEKRFGIPYVVGVPYGISFSNQLIKHIRKSMETQTSFIAWENKDKKGNALYIGEIVTGISLSKALEESLGYSTQVCTPLDCEKELLRDIDILAHYEEDIIEAIKGVDIVIADPLYAPLCKDKKFISFPHVAYSGRLYEKEIQNWIGKRIKLC